MRVANCLTRSSFLGDEASDVEDLAPSDFLQVCLVEDSRYPGVQKRAITVGVGLAVALGVFTSALELVDHVVEERAVQGGELSPLAALGGVLLALAASRAEAARASRSGIAW